MQLLQRITTASWPGEENLGDFTWQDADGSLHLKSLDDDFTAVSLDPNGFLVTVQYLYLLPYKVPEWTETSASSSTRSMKMAYTYTKVRSIFSVSAIPLQWQYPVHLLLRIRQTDQTDPLVLVSTQDDASYTELVPNKEY